MIKLGEIATYIRPFSSGQRQIREIGKAKTGFHSVAVLHLGVIICSLSNRSSCFLYGLITLGHDTKLAVITH